MHDTNSSNDDDNHNNNLCLTLPRKKNYLAVDCGAMAVFLKKQKWHVLENPDMQAGAQNKDSSSVSQTDITKSLVPSWAQAMPTTSTLQMGVYR